MANELEAASAGRLEETLRVLTGDIGVRLAGSPAETRAARWVAGRLAECGAAVREEEFPVRERRVEAEELEVRLGGAWRSFPCSLFSNTPGTAGRRLEAPLVFFEAPAEYGRSDLSHLRGKAVVHLGSHVESREHYRRLLAAGPAFLLFVDVRYPGAVPLADGMFPAYTEALGAVPTLNVAYLDAWRWKREGADAARLRVAGGMAESASRNVVAELPGAERAEEVIFVGCHHDTQADSVGADDNGSGTAVLLELARLLGKAAPLARTVRLVSFGAEEQLSVGSAGYVRRHRAELAAGGRFMLNFDACGSHLGWFELTAHGPAELAERLRQHYGRAGLFMTATTRVMPYADHFPFLAAGVPAAYVGRNNCSAGRFFHHRPDDDLDRVSVPLLARLADASAALLAELAGAEPWPYGGGVPADQAEAAARYWQDLFGGWRA